jgi:hypothetical protein
MFNVTYLSDDDRDRLLELHGMLHSAVTLDEQQDIHQEIRDIESKRKSLHECTIEECSELRATIWGKFEMLNRTGKYGIAINFKHMLALIEQRIQAINLEIAREEREKVQQKLKAAKNKRSHRQDPNTEPQNEKSKPSARSTTGSSKWTTGIGNLD